MHSPQAKDRSALYKTAVQKPAIPYHGLEDAADELKRIEALELARKEIEKKPQETELLFRTV